MLKRTTLGSILNLGGGEGFTVKYGAGATDVVTFAQDATARTTVQSLVDYMNADTSLAAANLNIDAALDSQNRYVYNVSYLSTSNSVAEAGLVSAAGYINATFGSTGTPAVTTVLSWAAAAGDGVIEIAEDVRAKIHALANYNAVSIVTGANAMTSFYVESQLANTLIDDSPINVAGPALNFVLDAAMTSTTAVLGKNIVGYRIASALSNTYAGSRFSLPNITPTVQGNLRITLRDTSGLGFNAAISLTAASAANSNTAIVMGATYNGGETQDAFLLVNGSNIITAADNIGSGTADTTATTYYVAAGANAGTENIQTAGVTVIATDRTGWL